MSFEDEFRDPPHEFSLMPFWFWNDRLDEAELLRQIAEFEANGVYGFVIHPRVGLPRDFGWMSDKLLGFYHVAINEAVRRDMKVLLYDEGMYPSGSSSGQVVAKYPDLKCRCLARHDPADALPDFANIVDTITDTDGRRWQVIDRPVDSFVRGLHYLGEGDAEDPKREDEPPAGDILNPHTTEAIIELVYGRFHEEFGQHFGKTILGIFTDEPNPLGRCRENGVMPGTTGILEHVSRLLGYDFRPHLAFLWSTDESARTFRDDYRRAIRMRLEETWYAPLSAWCEAHHVALCGHPDAGDEIGVQRHFQIPGQDLVWRWVAPDWPTALEGPESTQAKCSSSAMIHHGRRRNSNEFAGAYGPETTFDEIKWLANWCLIRGVNLLIPHAFYYSIRGPRKDERPPQIGPHTPRWNDFGPDGFKAFADHCRRLCWLNTDSQHLCDIAILTHDDRCPWPAAAALLRAGIDFNYLDPQTLLHAATVDASGIHICGMTYRLLIIDGPDPLRPDLVNALSPLIAQHRVAHFASAPAVGPLADLSIYGTAAALIDRCRKETTADLLYAHPSVQTLRVRRVRKHGKTMILRYDETLTGKLTTQSV